MAREFTTPVLRPCLCVVWASEQSPVCSFGCQTSEIFPQLLLIHLLQNTIVTHSFLQKLTLHPSHTLCLDAKDAWCVSYFLPRHFKCCKAICCIPLPLLMISLFGCVLSFDTGAFHTASHQIFTLHRRLELQYLSEFPQTLKRPQTIIIHILNLYDQAISLGLLVSGGGNNGSHAV